MEATEAAQHVEDLYKKYHPVIRDYLHGMCRNAHLADDLSSETFERALRSMRVPGKVEHENPIAWLRAIAKNLLTDHYRKAANRREIPGAFYDDPEPHASADVRVLEDESLAQMHILLESLTPGQRDVMVLRTLDGYTTAETADRMSRSPQAIRSLRHKALRRLLEVHAEQISQEPDAC